MKRTPYEEMVALLEPVFLGVCTALPDNALMRKQWTKERRAHLESNGWTDEEFYQVMDAIRKRKFNEPQPVVPLTPPPHVHGREQKQAPKAQVPSGGTREEVQAWYNLHEYVGRDVTYTSRNRRHTFRNWKGYEVTVSCFDERTGKKYWSCAVGVGPKTKVIDAVRAARVGAQA